MTRGEVRIQNSEFRNFSSTDLETLAGRFRSCTLPKAEWTHQAHLAVGAWHVERYGPDEALVRLRDGIRALNDSHGTVNSDTSGYHETITRAYVGLIARFLAGSPDDALQQRVSRLVNGPLGDRDLLLRHYSRENLMSVPARGKFVEPDLAPLSTMEDGQAAQHSGHVDR